MTPIPIRDSKCPMRNRSAPHSNRIPSSLWGRVEPRGFGSGDSEFSTGFFPGLRHRSRRSFGHPLEFLDLLPEPPQDLFVFGLKSLFFFGFQRPDLFFQSLFLNLNLSLNLLQEIQI